MQKKTTRVDANADARSLEVGIEELRATIIAMGQATECMVADAIQAVIAQEDTDRHARDIADRDDRVDQLDQAAEWKALELLATQQPVLAQELRSVGSAIKIITDFERIGDHAVNIARVAHRIRYAGIPYRGLADLERFQKMTCGVIGRVTMAYAERDTALAREVIAQDDELDVFYRETLRDLHRAMTAPDASPEQVLLCSHLLFVAHYLERIGDHCSNVAERILFIESGEHPGAEREFQRPLARK